MRRQVPKVNIEGEPVSVLQANERELLLAPKAHQISGMLTIETEPDFSTQTAFDLRPSIGGESGNGGNT